MVNSNRSSIGLVGDAGIGGDCCSVRCSVFVSGIGFVGRRRLVCE
jgi:hypothetical protein